MGLSLRNIGKKLLNFGEGAVNVGEAAAHAPYDIVRGAAASATGNSLALSNANEAKRTDYAKVLPLITRGYIETARTIEHPFTPNVYTPRTAQEKLIFGNEPIQNVAAGEKSTAEQHGALVGGLYAGGQLATTILPKTSGVLQLAKAGKVAKVAEDVNTAEKAASEAQPVEQAVAAPVAPTPKPNRLVSKIQRADAPSEQAPQIAKLKASLKSSPKDTAVPQVSTQPSRVLPKHLSGAKPSYNFGSKRFTLSFSDDVTKALYVVAGNKPSAREEEYLGFLRQHFPNSTDGEIKRIGQTIKAGIKERARVSEPGHLHVKSAAPPVSGTPQAPSLPTTVPTAGGTPPTGVPPNDVGNTSIPHSGIGEVDKAIQDLHQHYKETPQYGTSAVGRVIGVTNGYKKVGARLSNKLWNVINKHLSPEEQVAIYDDLQGVKNANLTERAANVSNSLKPLYHTAADVRQLVHGDKFNKVLHYAPRIERQTLGSAIRQGGVKGAIKSLADLGNLDSVFSRARTIGKYVDQAGNAVYGKASELGLTKREDGTLTDTAGKIYKPARTNTVELAQHLGKDYLEKIGHVSGIYHADTTALKARAEAIAELTTNPSAHGLYTEEQVANGVAPEGVKAINHNEFKTPDGQQLYAAPKDVKAIERDPLIGRPETTGLLGKAYDTASNFATQSIVLNPVFHGMNQLYQTAIAAGNLPGRGTGWFKVAKNMLGVTEDDVNGFLKAGGHSPDYGSTAEGVLSRVTGGATKINSKAMAAIELQMRVGLYKASIEAGMKPAKAIKNIDTFLGDAHAIPNAVRRTTLFAHYFKTMAGALGTQLAHPVEQAGSIQNTILLSAFTSAMSYGYKDFTGNKNAYVRAPGEIGLAKEIISSARDLSKGDIKDAAALGTNRINPVLKEGLQQTLNQDIFTGNRASDTKTVTIAGKTVIPGGRAGHAVQSLIAPAQQVEKGAGGKRSVPELATNQLGLYTPHAKGKVASTKVSLLNAKGDVTAPGNDPTGYSQQQAFFEGRREATQKLSTADLTLYNQMTASTSKMDNKQLQAHYALLSSNPKILSVITKQKQDYAKQTGTALDPLYSDKLTPQQRSEYFHLQSLPYKGDDYNQQKGSNAGWLDALNNARGKYFNANPIAAADASPSERVQSPTFSRQVEGELSQASRLSGKQKAQYIDSHPELTKAYDSIAKYTNAKRVAQGDAPFKLYPSADPDTQASLNAYEGLGSSSARSAWIRSNPASYKKVQDYLTNVSEYQLATAAGTDKYLGANPSQAELKSAYSLGQYDIAKTTDANGNTVYALNPSSSYGGSSGGGSSSGGGFNVASYKQAKFERKLALSTKNSVAKKSTKPKVSSKRAGTPGKVAVKNMNPILNKKVALRKSKV